MRDATPVTFAALARWFREAWEASLPARLHTGGTEAGDALGGPRWAGAFKRRITNATPTGWGLTGWDRDGQPRGVDHEGVTIDPFLYHLELRLRRQEADAVALVRWAYMGWDVAALAHSMSLHTGHAPEALDALLERGMRRLWYDCQHDPVRHAICRECRRGVCVCHQRSESQVNAEEAGLQVA